MSANHLSGFADFELAMELHRRGYVTRHKDELKVLQWNRIEAGLMHHSYNGAMADLKKHFEDEAVERTRAAITRDHLTIDVAADPFLKDALRLTSRLVIW